MFSMSAGSDEVASATRTLAMDLGYLLNFGMRNQERCLSVRPLSLVEWKAVLSMVEECLKAARQGGNKVDLKIEVQYMPPWEEKENEGLPYCMTEDLHQLCGSYGAECFALESEKERWCAWGARNTVLLDSTGGHGR